MNRHSKVMSGDTMFDQMLRRGARVAVAAWMLMAPVMLAPVSAAAAGVGLELNKLETTEKGCRVYVVVNNPGDTAYQSFKLDLVLFQPDGIIGKRLALDLAPIRAQKRTVKLFDFEGVPCDRIGSLLVNDMLECRTEAGQQSDCLAGLAVSSLTTVKLSK